MSVVHTPYPKFAEPAYPHQPDDRPVIAPSEQALELNETGPRSSGRERQIIVIVLGTVLASAVLVIIGLGFMQGSWWYPYGDLPLAPESRVRIEAIRDDVHALGTMPKVVGWLDTALDPNIDPTAVRYSLIAAQQAMQDSGVPRLVEIAKELRVIIETSQQHRAVITTTPFPTLEWPWE